MLPVCVCVCVQVAGEWDSFSLSLSLSLSPLLSLSLSLSHVTCHMIMQNGEEVRCSSGGKFFIISIQKYEICSGTYSKVDLI